MNLDRIRNSVPIVTPFDENLEIDLVSFTNHLDLLYSQGIRSLIIGGTTGEGITLFNLERELLIKTALDRYPDLLIWGGITTFSLQLKEILIAFNKANYLLVMPPFFIKPRSHDIVDFYKKLLQLSDQKIVIYNNPARTMVDISDIYEEIFDLSERIIGIKETRFDKIPEYPWWCGEDGKMLEHKGKYAGIISVIANIEPKLTNDILNNQEYDKDQLNALLEKMNYGANPLIVKYILWKRGILKTPRTRFPLKLTQEIINLL